MGNHHRSNGSSRIESEKAGVVRGSDAPLPSEPTGRTDGGVHAAEPRNDGHPISGDPLQGLGAASGHNGGEAATGAAGSPGGANSFDVLAALRDRLMRGSEAPFGLDDDPARTATPALWQLLTQRVGAKGKRKQTATVRTEATATGFRATLSDLTLSVALTVDCDHLDDVGATLEAAIRNPRSVWRDLRHGERATALKTQDSKKEVDWQK